MKSLQEKKTKLTSKGMLTLYMLCYNYKSVNNMSNGIHFEML